MHISISKKKGKMLTLNNFIKIKLNTKDHNILSNIQSPNNINSDIKFKKITEI